jgi:ABC-type antimicrobial peptide transport system permease subunit
VITAWFVFGSFVTYAPSVDATAMQNIYLKRIVTYAAAIAILNVSAILFLGLGRRSGRGD